MEKTRNATQLALAKQCDIDVPEGRQPRDSRGGIASLDHALKTGRETLRLFISTPSHLEMKRR
jgi:hypothetical protein